MCPFNEAFFSEENIGETAFGAAQMRSKKLALYIKRRSGEFSALLYDPSTTMLFLEEKLAELVEEEKQANKTEKLSKKQITALTEEALGLVLYNHGHEVSHGTITGKWVGGDCQAFEINMAGAKHGYGPFMYDVVGGIFGWIMSDRATVSKSARSVWSWMYNHPEAYHKREQNKCAFVWNRKPKKSEVPLQYAYSPKVKKIAKTKALVNNHQKFEQRLRKAGVSKTQIDLFLYRVGEALFNVLYLDK